MLDGQLLKERGLARHSWLLASDWHAPPPAVLPEPGCLPNSLLSAIFAVCNWVLLPFVCPLADEDASGVTDFPPDALRVRAEPSLVAAATSPNATAATCIAGAFPGAAAVRVTTAVATGAVGAMGIAALKKRSKTEAGRVAPRETPRETPRTSPRVTRATATPSPNSVAAPLDAASDAESEVDCCDEAWFRERDADAPTRALPLASLSLGYLYHQFIAEARWDMRFHRGARPEPPPPLRPVGGGGCGPFLSAIYGSQRAAAPAAVTAGQRSRERTLATSYLSHPSVDGWNVVFGATELARAWALRDLSDFPLNPELPEEYDLPLPIRKRLAACLSLSFKFQRAMYSYFPRDFYDEEHSLLSPHTKELAHVGFAFMTRSEEREFGGWGVHNKPAIDALYTEMLALEVDLLVSTDTFSLLTCNFQVIAEDVLAGLLDRGLRTDKETLALRALAAFYGKAAAGPLHVAMARMPPMEAATGLVCAAWVSASRSTNARLFHSSNGEVRSLFDASARTIATRLLRAALVREGMQGHNLTQGAFSDPSWWGYPLVQPSALRSAIGALRQVGARM